MPEYSLRPQALSDMQEIWDYTTDRWGEGRAEQYLRMLDKAFGDLAKNPSLGLKRDDIRAGYRKHTAGRHIVFYRVMDAGVEIVRILHQRMDVGNRL